MERTFSATCFILLKLNLQVKLVLRMKRTSSGLLRGTGLKVQGRRVSEEKQGGVCHVVLVKFHPVPETVGLCS